MKKNMFPPRCSSGHRKSPRWLTTDARVEKNLYFFAGEKKQLDWEIGLRDEGDSHISKRGIPYKLKHFFSFYHQLKAMEQNSKKLAQGRGKAPLQDARETGTATALPVWSANFQTKPSRSLNLTDKKAKRNKLQLNKKAAFACDFFLAFLITFYFTFWNSSLLGPGDRRCCL